MCAALALSTASLIPALPLRAQQAEQPQETTAQEGRRVHVVRTGDTLWDLARFYLEDPFLWPEIYRLNTMVVEDPHWIYPEERLRLPGDQLAEAPDGGTPEPERPELVEPTGQLATIFAEREFGGRTLVYQPGELVPAVAVPEGDFHGSGFLAPVEELGPLGHVVEHIDYTVVRTEQPPTVHRYSRIYVSHPGGERPTPGDRLLLFRVEDRIRPYGHVIRPTGEATIAAVHDEVSTAVVTRLYGRVLPGDRVAHMEPYTERPGVFAEPVEMGPDGILVGLLDRQPVVAPEDIAFIDVGRAEDIAVGDEFEIYLQERRSRDGYRLPQEHVAVARVVRVTENTATVRLIEMRHAAVQVGLPVRLVRKMPS